MSVIDIKVPALPESVMDARVLKWHKKVGEACVSDQPIVDLETDKVVLEIPALSAGVIASIQQPEGSTVRAGDILGTVEAGAVATTQSSSGSQPSVPDASAQSSVSEASLKLSPSARRAAQEHPEVDVRSLEGSGVGGRLTQQDFARAAGRAAASGPVPQSAASPAPSAQPLGARATERVPMTRLRARIAERLLQAKQNTAMLTTFNEVNMAAVMALRARLKESFEKRHGVRLGFMSFFAKAAAIALQRFPAVNAFIEGQDIVYHGYCDLGVAVSTERGLVVPVLRGVEHMSFSDVEREIGFMAERARTNQLTLEEMTGGTFTITNGGVFGSLMATPILNPPQSAILGMHKIEDRPIAEKGQVVIRPMMYVALSYDHRIIDGRESVQFLATIKELVEDPERLLLDV